MVKAIWVEMVGVFEIDKHHQKGEEKRHFMGRAASTLRALIEIQNICVAQKDGLKAAIDKSLRTLPRNYHEVVN